MEYINELVKNINNNKFSISKFLSIDDQQLINKTKDIIFFPSYCERKRAIIHKTNDQLKIDDFISIIKIDYNKKYGLVGHRDVLGSLMGLGIKRECIGDILISENIYVFVLKEMENYILLNLVSIGKVNVSCTLSNFNEIETGDINNYIEQKIIVSSYRLDVIISEICSMSRERAKQYICLKNVKVKGVVNTNPDYNIKIDELISIHRFGRLIIKEELNKTKKDKYVLRVFKTK